MYRRQEMLKIRIAKQSAIENNALRNLVAVHVTEAMYYFGIRKALPERNGQDNFFLES